MATHTPIPYWMSQSFEDLVEWRNAIVEARDGGD